MFLWGLDFNSFSCIGWGGIGGLYCSFNFFFDLNLHTTFHSDYTNFFFLHILAKNVTLWIFDSRHLFVRWYLVIILICIPLMINDAKYLFIDQLVFLRLSWRTIYSVSLHILTIKIFVCCSGVICVPYIIWILTL